MEDRADLVRCWVEFDLSGHEATPAAPGTITLDGGDRTYRLLARGIGVTGYDRDDCLALVRDAIGGDPVPPMTRLIEDVDVDALGLAAEVSVPVWRGIWFPRLNLNGPTKLRAKDGDYAADVPDYRVWRTKPWYPGIPIAVVLYRTPEGWRFATTTQKDGEPGGIVDGRLNRPELSDDEAKALLLQSLRHSDGVELDGGWHSDKPDWWHAALRPVL